MYRLSLPTLLSPVLLICSICAVSALYNPPSKVTGHIWTRRNPYYRPSIDVSKSIWTPVGAALPEASRQDNDNSTSRSAELLVLTPIDVDSTTSGFEMDIKRPSENDLVHAVIKREQERNKLARRFDKDTASIDARDGSQALLLHHEELTRRGIRSGLSIRSNRFVKRATNNFQVSPAIAPTLANSAALDEDGQDVSYFSTLRIGSNSKAFRVVMDSGSSDLWVPAGDCTSAACQNHATLATGDSTTLKVSTQPWKIQYGSGSASGFLVQDVLQMAGMQTRSVTFGTASTLSDTFTNFPSDGILGLGMTSASAEKVPTFMDNLATAGLITRKLFAVNLQRAADSPGVNARDGQISFGKVDTTKFTGNLVTTPNVAKSGLWEAKMDSVTVNGQSINLGTSPTGIIDTGTTLVLAPPTIAKAMHAMIPGAQTDGQGSFAIPCTTQVPMTFSFGGTQFFIDPRDYLGAPVSNTGTMCLSNISGQQIGGAGQFLMGDVFLKNVYTVFDVDNNQIGFGAKDAATTTNNGKRGTSTRVLAQDSSANSGTAPTGMTEKITAHTASSGASRL